MMLRFVTTGFLTFFCITGFAFAEDPYDGPGDTPDQPDVWVTPTENGSLVTPGDNQPVQETREADGTQSFDFDQPMSQDSEIVVTPDEGPSDTGSDTSE